MSLEAKNPSRMTGARRDGLILLMLGALVFVLLGVALESSSPVAMVDFGVVYFPSRCLLQHGDPYNQADVLKVFQAEGGDRIWSIARERAFMTRLGYPPATFSVTAPIAILPWGPAHILWMALIAGSMIFAAFLVWSFCADSAPLLSGALIGFLLANCQATMVLGNAAGIAVGLCAVAVWCFLRNRYVLAGVLCFALSLAIKPHNAWLIWVYFLLAGGVYRKRALQTLAATALIGLPALVWVWRVAPHWLSEMRANLAWFAGPGGPCDPGLRSGGSHGIDMLVNLQAVVSVFFEDPHLYQPITYAVCACLLLAWGFSVARSRPSPQGAWILIASAAALSVLPFYHHVHDAKLILLAVPACVHLQAASKWIARAALAVTATAFLFTGDLVWTAALSVLRNIPPPASWLGGQALTAVQIFPAPLAILLLGVFYLCAGVHLAHAEKSHDAVKGA
ncbi:MAG: glycosyltransferase family 87 protein [Terracidiphilus sp.]